MFETISKAYENINNKAKGGSLEREISTAIEERKNFFPFVREIEPVQICFFQNDDNTFTAKVFYCETNKFVSSTVRYAHMIFNWSHKKWSIDQPGIVAIDKENLPIYPHIIWTKTIQ